MKHLDEIMQTAQFAAKISLFNKNVLRIGRVPHDCDKDYWSDMFLPTFQFINDRNMEDDTKQEYDKNSVFNEIIIELPL